MQVADLDKDAENGKATIEEAAPPQKAPPSRRCRRTAMAACGLLLGVGLTLLPLVLLPTHRFGVEDLRLSVGFRGKDVVVSGSGAPRERPSWVHEVHLLRADCDVVAAFEGDEVSRVGRVVVTPRGRGWPLATREPARARGFDAVFTDADFGALRRIGRGEDVAATEATCDVTTRTKLWGLVPLTATLRGVGAGE